MGLFMQTHVLIADSETQNTGTLALHLENSGFAVHTAVCADEAFSILEAYPVRCAIIDMALPGINGHAMIKRLRAGSGIPILAISASGIPDSDKILALNLGADDFMEKPLNPLELLARVGAHLRRSAAESSSALSQKLQRGAICLDSASLNLTKNGTLIPITLAEYKILLKLMSSPGVVFSKSELYECINNSLPESGRDTISSDENTIMVHISKIRDKLEESPRSPRYIRTVRGQGYRFDS